jgi:DNA-binding LytR/AlgR family response regulator
MTVLIIEDEPQAAARMQTLVKAHVANAHILAVIDSVSEAVQWFREQPTPDLVFMDIQLADGVSFQIFEQVEVKAPIIFTTAYDEYALRAFKVNSIDYLLKPVDDEEMLRALGKYEQLKQSVAIPGNSVMESMQKVMQMLGKKYKERFIIRAGEHLKTIEVSQILFFFSLEKVTFAQTPDGRKHVIDFTLEQLEEMIDPQRFFRINRKYIVSVDAIQDMFSYTNARLKVTLKSCEDTDIIVARERVQDFRQWLDR